MPAARSPQDHPGEKAGSASGSKGCSHQFRVADIGDVADGPERADPVTRSMRNRGGQENQTAFAIDMRRLDDRKFVLAECLANNVESSGERGVSLPEPTASVSTALEDGSP